MTKIVYNTCFGGFGLSDAAVLRYGELKGIRFYLEKGQWSTVFWLLPPEERVDNGANQSFWADSIERDDPILVQVVEELGEAANGDYADLHITEISSGTLYRIDEYDGRERVMTVENYTWRTA